MEQTSIKWNPDGTRVSILYPWNSLEQTILDQKTLSSSSPAFSFSTEMDDPLLHLRPPPPPASSPPPPASSASTTWVLRLHHLGPPPLPAFSPPPPASSSSTTWVLRLHHFDDVAPPIWGILGGGNGFGVFWKVVQSRAISVANNLESGKILKPIIYLSMLVIFYLFNPSRF